MTGWTRYANLSCRNWRLESGSILIIWVPIQSVLSPASMAFPSHLRTTTSGNLRGEGSSTVTMRLDLCEAYLYRERFALLHGISVGAKKIEAVDEESVEDFCAMPVVEAHPRALAVY